MVKHNNVVPNVHMRKHNQNYYRTWFNQPAKKRTRQLARQAKAARVYPRPLERLRPLVHAPTRKYNSKIRYGRGFSLLELKKAGLTGKFAQTVGIAVDHRRQDSNQEVLEKNVARLENYKSKIILFPIRDGKLKKGEIADSTADKLKSAAAEQQNKDSHLMAKPKTKLRVKVTKISDDLKKQKVYRKLRQELVNKYYHGKREKKAKEDKDK